MKNVDSMGGHKKTIIYGDLPRKGGLDNLERARQKIGRRLFLTMT